MKSDIYLIQKHKLAYIAYMYKNNNLYNTMIYLQFIYCW